MLRSYTPADALTIGNAACGTICIFLCIDYLAFGDVRRVWIAIGLLPLALILDALDGYVARLSRTRQSLLGADLDSLSDIISFAWRPRSVSPPQQIPQRVSDLPPHRPFL
jgi:CDP-diacylglycerol--serine O-phosphatidyltransferase